MKLNNLLNVLRGGNLALGQKLRNLLTEDCEILEYTDDAVLFQKHNHLVLAKFKHTLSESSMSAEDVLDNEIIYISGKESEKSLNESIFNIVDSLVEENYLAAETELSSFCEQYYQYSVLKQRYPFLFTENLVKKSKGLHIRQAATKQIPSFRSDIFGLATISESTLDATEYVSVIEQNGLVLALGKHKILPIVTDALLGNQTLAEQITTRLYDTALSLTEANEDLMKMVGKGYDLESGKYKDEDAEEVAGEDLDVDVDSIESEFPGDEDDESAEPTEFEEFDPSKLSDEEIKILHVDILKSFLDAMGEFVGKEAQNPENTAIDPDLDDKLKEDLEKLSDMAITDEELSRIEADWQPVLSFFLSSDMYKSDQDMESDEMSLEDTVDGGEDAELANEVAEEEPSEIENAVEEPETPEEEEPETPEEKQARLAARAEKKQA